MVYFITGIDTGIGKTYITGLLGHYLLRQGHKVITQKLVQTGVQEMAEDILSHRKIMQMDLQSEDKSGLTCPYLFPLAASPHLAAAKAGSSIDPEKITSATKKLEKSYDIVLLEGAGGIMVPLTRQLTILDYLKVNPYPTLVVSSPRLGSINHTLLTLEALKSASIPIKGLIYNMMEETDPLITLDTLALFHSKYPQLPILTVPKLATKTYPEINFKLFFD